MARQRFAGALAVLTLCAVSTAAAQRRSAALIGRVQYSSGTPVADADIDIAPQHAVARTDSAGRFTLRGLDPGKISVLVRHIGDDPQRFDIELRGGGRDSVFVTMSRNVQFLEAMRTQADIERRMVALKGFYRRRARGEGTFFTREELEARHTNMLSEALRGVPGLEIEGHFGSEDVRMRGADSRQADCPPQYWVDGTRVNDIQSDAFPVTDIEAIEIYAGPATTPPQFPQSAAHYTCGTIVLWTRLPGES